MSDVLFTGSHLISCSTLFGLVRIQSRRIHHKLQHFPLLKLNDVHCASQTLGTRPNSLDNLFGVALSIFSGVMHACSHLCDDVPVSFSQGLRPPWCSLSHSPERRTYLELYSPAPIDAIAEDVFIWICAKEDTINTCWTICSSENNL